LIHIERMFKAYRKNKCIMQVNSNTFVKHGNAHVFSNRVDDKVCVSGGVERVSATMINFCVSVCENGDVFSVDACLPITATHVKLVPPPRLLTSQAVGKDNIVTSVYNNGVTCTFPSDSLIYQDYQFVLDPTNS